jgi:CO/xanthine dehydrogenase FAD-binding subunit
MDVLRPTTLDEALALKAQRPEAVPIAGGTDLMVELNAHRRRPEAMLDVSHLPELHEWRREGGSFFLGAGVSYARIIAELAELMPLAQAARTVGSPPIRIRGTIGGNLGTASPAGDALPALAAYDAEIVLASTAGRRALPWHEFLLGPKRTALRSDELIVGARWPLHAHRGSFSKIGTRNAIVIAVASLTLVLDEELRRVRVALGSVGPTVLRAPEAEQFAMHALAEGGWWDEMPAPLPAAVAAEFGVLVAGAARPIDDVRGTAAYRREACRVLGERALRWLVAERTPAAEAA